jgi:hypothetical protein
VPKFVAEVRAEVPNAVVAKGRLASDARTADLELAPAGGSWRRIRVAVVADDRGAANAKAIELLQDVLGDTLTGELWVEQIDPL